MSTMPLFCEVCRINLLNENDRKTHFIGKKHKQNEGIVSNIKNTVERSLHVGGTNGLLDMQLKDYFSQFGAISKVHLDPKTGSYAFVEFANKESRESCLKIGNHRINGKNLRVSPKQFKPFYAKSTIITSKQNTHLTEFELNHYEVVEVKLNEIKSVKEQILKLPWITTLSQDEMRARLQFAKVIEKHIQEVFPNAAVYIYGSCGSGYGFKGCDIDFSVNIPDYDASLPREDVEATPSLKDIREGYVNAADLVEKLSLKWMLQFLKKVVLGIPKVSRVMVIPSVRCPILRFQNMQMRISCDMSVNKLVGIANTKLLKHYGRLDVRVRPLLLTLRYWAKINDLLESSHKLSSYAFSWLVIFYLQNCEPPIVPTVQTLQNLADKETIVDGHNIAFCEDFDKIPKTKNSENIEDLLKSFFHFYYSFDFTMNAICPLTGKATDRAWLKEQNIDTDFKLTPITVQDPFELERNITTNTSASSAVEILEKIDKARIFFQSEEFKKFGLTLFLVKDQSADNEKGKKRKLPIMDEQDLVFTIPFTDKIIDSMREDVSKTESETMVSEIFKLACRAVYNILEDGLQMSCQVTLNNLTDLDNILQVTETSVASTSQTSYSNENCNQIGQKIQKTSIDNERNRDNDIPLMRIFCGAFYKTWQGRRNKRPDVSFPISPIDSEKQISLALIEETKQEKNKNPFFEFEVELFKQKKGAMNMLKVSLIPKGENKEFKNCVSVYLRNYIPRIVELCLTYTPKV